MIEISYIPIDQLKAYENNAKIHTQDQIDKIKLSIQQFGMNDPIAVWKDNTIIEGHGRFMACKQLGFDKIPVVRLDQLSDEQRRAYMLVHNKLAVKTGMDYDKIFDELASISEIDMKPFDIVQDFDMSGLDEFPLLDKQKKKQVKCPYCGQVFEL